MSDYILLRVGNGMLGLRSVDRVRPSSPVTYNSLLRRSPEVISSWLTNRLWPSHLKAMHPRQKHHPHPTPPLPSQQQALSPQTHPTPSPTSLSIASQMKTARLRPLSKHKQMPPLGVRTMQAQPSFTQRLSSVTRWMLRSSATVRMRV